MKKDYSIWGRGLLSVLLFEFIIKKQNNCPVCPEPASTLTPVTAAPAPVHRPLPLPIPCINKNNQPTMKDFTKTIKTLALCIGMLMIAGGVKGTDYYLRNAAKANQAGSWFDTPATNGGNVAIDFLADGNKFIIPSTITNAVFDDNQNPNVTFGPNVILEVNGKFEIKAGNTKTTNFTINGTVIFTNATQGQVTLSGTGTKKFTLAPTAVLKTSNANGITGTNASIQIPAAPSVYTITLPNTAHYEFNGTDQTMAGLPATVNHLTLLGSGTKSLTQATTITGNLSIGNGITFNTGNYLITFSGGNAQSISGFTTAGDVAVSKTAGTTASISGISSFNNLTITSGQLMIPAGSQVTVKATTDITPAKGLTIESLSAVSGGAGTGSFMTAAATGPGTIFERRYMSPRKWHMVSSSVFGQTIADFLTNNPNIPANTVAGHTTERGMRDYNPVSNEWNNFFTNGTDGKLETGKGYLMRVKSSPEYKEVQFTGKMQAGNQSAIGLEPGKWNCTGNPYTSALRLISTGATDNFLAVNAGNLDMSYGGIYIWRQTNETTNDALATGSYDVVSNASGLPEIQQGQAFMVKMANVPAATSVNFTYAMQSHQTALELKSTDGVWPAIKLMATADSMTSSTLVAFHQGMTPGLDPTYDAGLLKGGASMEIYTRLLEDNGIPFDIQALPSDQYDQLIIPVGVDYPQGGAVCFSAQGTYLPVSCRPILEDRLTGIKTDLTDKTYTAELTENTAGTGRFYLHTFWSSTGADSPENGQQLTAWAQGNNEINIKGQINNGAVASLFDLQGRLIATRVLREGTREHFSVPAVKAGIYLLQVRDRQQVQVIKVRIGE